MVTVRGRQLISRFKEEEAAANDVAILMAVIRLPTFRTEVLVTLR